MSIEKKYQALKNQGHKLDITRGKPSREQLNLSSALASNKIKHAVYDSTDIYNYGNIFGVKSCRELGARLLDMPFKQIIAGGNSSLSLIYFNFLIGYLKGFPDVTAWNTIKDATFICLTPGYDRHFSICEHFGVKMLEIPLLENGVDIKAVQRAVEQENVVGMWCVPKYSNPSGHTYCPDTVKRLACLKPKQPAFKIFWDNAYAHHHIYEHERLDSIWDVNPEADHVLQFASTSKITLAGSGVSFVGASTKNITHIAKMLGFSTIGFDKVNQQRHAEFLPDEKSLITLMQKHADILRPKFDIVINALESLDTDLCHFEYPKGGYFVSFRSKLASATKIIKLAKEAGVILTPAGSTHPYKRDATDSYIRIAPSFASVDELKIAMQVFCLSVQKASST